MPLTPNYCAQCGQPVVTRAVDGRSRVVCPGCETVFYENPLPVAAALVLNERREVLLVRRARPPKKDLWCLPMGFAEIGETIAQAAARELAEEAGIQARILRLVDADSFTSSHYGDLLVVTYEMRKIGGIETAGDDASDVGYFPLGRHPALAFTSNEKALRICTAEHLEEWEVQDSFLTLAADEDKALLADVLLESVTQRADEIVTAWLTDVRSHPSTPSYHPMPPDPLRERAARALSQFGRWLKGHEADHEIETFYRDIGAARRRQQIPLHEVLSSLSLLKKHLWTCARAHDVWQRPIEAYRVLEFNRLMAVFFDKAAYYAVRGFDGE